MQGTVRYLNRDDGLAAIDTGDAGYALVGLLDAGELDVGDSVAGELDREGAADLENRSRGATLQVYVETTAASEDFARQQVG